VFAAALAGIVLLILTIGLPFEAWVERPSRRNPR